MKRLLLFLVIVASSSALIAQTEVFDGQLYLGVGGGGMTANVDFVPSIPQSLMFSYQGGIAAKYVSEKHLGLVAELNLRERDGKRSLILRMILRITERSHTWISLL